MDSHPASDPKISVRNTDLLLALFFGAMILLADEPAQRLPLIGLGIIQLFESRLPFLSQTTGRVVSVTLQLLLAFELMHESGGVASPYFPILLLPLVSTATYLGVIATVLASVAAVGALLSPLLF